MKKLFSRKNKTKQELKLGAFLVASENKKRKRDWFCQNRPCVDG